MAAASGGAVSGRQREPMSAFEAATYANVTRRLLPFLVICYIVAYLDRVNVSLAKLQMLSDLKMSDAAYGLGAGIFFVGYFIFELPSNLILHRVGARLWIARIMITWGIIAAAMAFTGPLAHLAGMQHPDTMFYILRFLLGAAEAGFFPGLLLYLTYWFPAERQARIVSMLMSAQPVAFILGAPLSGWLMDHMAGVFGYAGWRWMFVMEAVPAVLLGIMVALLLDNGVDAAKWLNGEEKRLLSARLSHDNRSKPHLSLGALFAQRFLWTLFGCWFLLVIGVYGINFWLPSIIKGTGHLSSFSVGMLTAIPYAVTAAAMNVICNYVEPRNLKRRFLIILCAVGGVGLITSAQVAGSLTLTIICLTVAMAASMTASALFWSLPGEMLTGTAAAAAIAAINSVGNLGGFAGPYLLGTLKDHFGSNEAGLSVLGLCLVASAAIALSFRRDGTSAARTPERDVHAPLTTITGENHS